MIGSLDENGFLSGNLSDLALLSGIALEDLQFGLGVLQSFDPIGIASLDLQDCLLKQMDAREMQDSHSYQIVKDHFPLLIRRRFRIIPQAFATNRNHSPGYRKNCRA